MLSSTALADLARRTRGLSLRFDQVRRDLIEFDAPDDCPNTTRRVREIEADAATIAELETVLAALQRAEREERPTHARRPGLYARTLEAITRPALSPDRTVRPRGDHACPPSPFAASRILSASLTGAASPRSATST